jgi:hypothetical protein
MMALVLACVIVTLVAWAMDEHAGRSRWMRIERAQTSLVLGEGAFREATVTLHHAWLARDRAPCLVRLLALSCYAPLGASVALGVPWGLGLAFLGCYVDSAWRCDLWANALLVSAYPFGCWAALRMHRLGRALLGGELTTCRESFASAIKVVVPLNLAIVSGALALVSYFSEHDTAWWLIVVPCVTFVQVALIAAVVWLPFARTLWPSPGGADVRGESRLRGTVHPGRVRGGG